MWIVEEVGEENGIVGTLVKSSEKLDRNT